MKRKIASLLVGFMLIGSVPQFAVETGNEYSAGIIPVMTSNAGVNGFVPFASTEYQDRAAYRAFDGTIVGGYGAKAWEATGGSNEFLGVELPQPRIVNKVTIQDSDGYHPVEMEIQASQDKSNWVTLASKNKYEWAVGEVLSIEFGNNTAYKYYRLYAKRANAEAIVGEFQLYELIKPAAMPQIKITAPDKVNAGQTFDVIVSAENMKNIYAEDISFVAGSSAFQIVSTEEISSRQDVYHNKTMSDGFRAILASQNEETGIQTSEQLFKVTLKALNVPSGTVSIKNALIADHLGVETTPLMDEKTITIIQVDADVNNDGKYSLGDLSMAAFNKNKDKARWSTLKADVNKSDTVDETDLSLIVDKILN